MSDYTITTDFGAKDSLPSGNAAKVIKGSEFTTEFTNIKTAVATKADTAGDTFTGAVTFDSAVTVNSTATITGDLTVDTNTLFVDVSENKVGIGTTSPDQALHLYQGALKIESGAPRIYLTDVNHDSDYSILNDNGLFGIYDDTNTAYRLRIDSSGNVGIGTTTVGQFASTDVGLTVDSGNDYSGIAMTDGSTTSTLAQGFNTTYLYNQANGSMLFGTNNTERMRIDSSGKVGIGTTSPQDKLHVSTGTDTDSGNIAFTIGGTSTSNARTASITKNTSTPYELTIQAGNHATSNMETVFKSSDSKETMRIDSSGNVGIGTTSPLYNLVVNDSASSVIQIRSGNDDAGHLYFADTNDDNIGAVSYSHQYNFMNFKTNDTERMRIDSSGNVLVGRTSGSADDEDNGVVLSPTGFIYSARGGTGSANHIAFINNTDATAITVGTIRSSGSTTSYNTSSDERLKENITDSADAGSKVDAIQIRQFDWKADGSHQDYGVIAQELVEVAPEAVSEGDTEEDMMGVDYSKLVPMLIKEVQSLRSRVAELENV